MTYYFDFDGTIINLWERFYRVFIDINGFKNISFEDYKNAKLKYMKDGMVASSFGLLLCSDYFEKKKILLESSDYLFFDKLLVDKNRLLNFFSNNDCYIITKRREKENFYAELNNLGIGELNKKTIVINPDLKISKADYLEKNGNKPFIIIGDSVEEYNVRLVDKAFVCLVNTGLNSFSDELSIGNCLVIDSLNCFFDEIKNGKFVN